MRGGLRGGLLGVCLDRGSTPSDAPDPDRGRTAASPWFGTPQSQADAVGKTLPPGGLFGPAAPHHRGDRPTPGAAGAPSGRLHPQANHRPRQTPRLGRDRGPAGESHDCQRQGSMEQPGSNVTAKAGLNRSVLDNIRASGVASWPTRRHVSGRSCGWYRLRPPRRRARHVAIGTRRPGQGAGGCSPALAAGTRRTPTPTLHGTSSSSPPDGR